MYATGALIAYAAYRLVGTYRRHAGGAGRTVPVADSPIPSALLLIAMIFFAGCFCAIQALPTLQLFSLSNRMGITSNFAFLGSIPPLGLVSLIAPHFFGDEIHSSWGEAELHAPDFYPHASTLYIGFFTLALVIIALFARRDRWQVRFFGLLGLTVLWFALGKFGYLYRVITYVPILRNFRDIENINMLVPLSASVLASIGLDRYREPGRGRAVWLRTGQILFIILVAATILWTVTLWRTWRTGGIVLLGYPHIRHAIGESALFVLAAVSLSAVLLWLRARHPGGAPGWLTASVTAFVVADLLYTGLPFASARTTLRAAEEQEAAVVGYLATDRSLYRVLGLSELAQLFGAQDVEGGSGLLLGRYSEYTNFLQGYALDAFVRPGGVHGVLITRGLDSTLLGLLNVKYIIRRATERVAPGLGGRPGIGVAPGAFVHVNPNVSPRVLDAYGYTVLQDRLAILRELSRPGYDPRRRVVLEESPRLPPDELPSGEPPSHPADLRVASYAATRVVIHARFARPGFLVLHDLYYPAWTASVDGRPTTIYRANYLFRAVVVPAGDHEVQFVYRDRLLEVGAATSGVAGIAGVLAWVVDRTRRRRNAAPVGGEPSE